MPSEDVISAKQRQWLAHRAAPAQLQAFRETGYLVVRGAHLRSGGLGGGGSAGRGRSHSRLSICHRLLHQPFSGSLYI
jgi:hypothetical protein